MRRLLALPAVTTLGLSLLVGCSGDDQPGGDEPSVSGSEDSTPVPATSSRCRVDVEVEGEEVDVAWSGRARVRLSGSEPSAVYSASHQGNRISVYSQTGDNTARANVTIDGQTYTTPLGVGTGLDVREDGSGAVVSAGAVGLEGPGVVIEATFDCAEQGGEQAEDGVATTG